MGVEVLAGPKDGSLESVCSLTLGLGAESGRNGDFDVFGEEEVLQNAAEDDLW